MRNLPNTLQKSIFEPLYCPESELHSLPKKLQAGSWFAQNLSPSSPPPPPPSPSELLCCAQPTESSPPTDSCICNTKRAPLYDHALAMHGDMNSPFLGKKAKSEHDLTSDMLMHGKYSSASSSSTGGSRSSSDNDDDDDDGSVASKLLASITKSISSPSLLACCKESARETPYQKTLRLRRMKLQHCAEEIGSESSDSSSCYGGGQSMYDKLGMSPSSSPPFTSSQPHKETEISPSSMITVWSAPNLSVNPMISNHSSYIKGRSFPPPLSHTLPASGSSDSFSFSLRPHREDGHFVLKEVRVPCRKYLQANRKDGRLTLQLFTRDDEHRENFVRQQHEEAFKEYHSRELPEKEYVDTVSYQAGTGNTIQEAEEVESNNMESQEVDSSNTDHSIDEGVFLMEESKEVVDVGMDEFEASIAISNAILHNYSFEKVQCLSDEGLLIATIEGSSGGGGDDDDDENAISNVVASRLKNSDCKATMHKTEMLSSHKLSANPLLSGSLKQPTLIHPPGKIHGSPSSHYNMSTLSQSMENFVWESNGKSLQRGYGAGAGGVPSPTILLGENISAECHMEKVTKLVASFGLEAGCGGKWWLGKMKPSLAGVGAIRSAVNAIIGAENEINVGVSAINGRIDGGSNDINGRVSLEYGHELKAFEGGTGIARSLPSPLHFDLQIPSTIQAALQGNEWFHTLHCKELSDRHQLAKGFMKLHCVAT